MEKAFLTAAALRNANGGTMTIKLWTSLISGDLPFLMQGLCHGPALVENSPNFKLSFFFFSYFLFSLSYNAYFIQYGNILLGKSNKQKNNQKTPLRLVILFNFSLDCFHRQGL